ncbi:MAG: threonine--tRNA ligase [Lachnospiraceae bacterium]|nr:threonine--tRNA ligase [Lachnospiraceae bacterium]
MKITLKDGSVREYAQPMSVIDIAKDISEGLARNTCAGEVNGEIVDLRTVLSEDCTLNIVTSSDPRALSVLRHTTSHIMAEAVLRLYPNAKVTIGPSIEDGFYYDFESDPFSREDLDRIEDEMKKIIKEGHELTRFTMPRAEAIKYFEEKGQPFKVELIQDLPEDAEISFYDQGGFVDLCAGPHLQSTKNIKAFKLLSSSMAYWRGDSNRARLQRIYGTAFFGKDELAAHLAKLEDAKMRDHNRLGREMKLFLTVDVIGQGLPLFTPKGTKMLMKLQRWIEDMEDNEWGYVRTRTPLMAKSDLYKISGHWDHYMDGMFILNKDDESKELMALRPMTCPFQYNVFMNEQHSYRDMPVRMAETSTLFRNEDSGEMHGLTRVRQFTITEAHLIIRPDQAEVELNNVVDRIDYVLKTLGLEGDVSYRLSKWDPVNREKYLGDDAYWENTQKYLRDVMIKKGISFTEAEGEAAFYGPKIDIQAKNVYGKEDTMITVQLDCAAAEKFGMYYIDEKGEKVRPWVVHRTSLGCYERTLAWLIEHYAGKFPTWMCAEQVRVLPISDKFEDYAFEVAAKLKKAHVDCTVDHRSEKIGYKIREARLDKIPYMLVVGQKESEDGTVAVRSRFAGDEGVKPLDEFIAAITKEIETKEIREEIPQDNAQ